MTLGEFREKTKDASDDADIFIDVPDEEGNMPEASSCEVDEEGDVILVPEGE